MDIIPGDIRSGLSPEILDSFYDGVYILGAGRKIEFWNKAAERISGHPVPDVLGKSCADHILTHLNEDGQSICRTFHCPVDQAFADGEIHETRAYLQHRAGQRVPVEIRTIPVRDARNRISKVIEIFREQFLPEFIQQRITELEKLSLLDPLTSIANRRFAEITLSARLAENQRNTWIFGLLFIDIDKFKLINDQVGHQAGDQVLKMVSRTLANTVRSYDAVTRWGGEEFVVMVANVNAEKLPRVAEKLRRFVENSILPIGNKTFGVTVSIGATLVRPDDTMESIVNRADQAMYQCKRAGGNCVRFAD